jgi:crossover junction endodeoxyribonuclease RuvC
MSKLIQKRILGVDPGTNILGYAIIDTQGQDLKLVQMGTIHLQKFEDHQTKLKEIYLQLQEVIEIFLPQEMAIESPFYGKNVQSMLKLGRAQGVSIAAGITMGLNIQEYSPKKIKQSVTGNGNASKEQVSGMLKHIVTEPFFEKHFDATDALAAAVCHHQQLQNPMAALSKGSGWAKFLKENPGRIAEF